jgi:2-keto-4-pentenoate hydratase/2-oxohepta-3-ene-1,7-dioic acid hydratase in catechol pathway
VLATGTPSGVGAAMKPPQFLRVGDVMRAEIAGLGYLENTVIAEPV